MISKILKQARERKKWSIHLLAEKTEVDPALISKYENGKRMPSKQHLSTLVEILHIDEEVISAQWLSEKVYQLVHSEKNAVEALRLTIQSIENKKKYNNEEDRIQQELMAVDDAKTWYDPEIKTTDIIHYVYAMNQLCGNTAFTLEQTRQIIEEGITIGGKSMREHMEVLNHYEAVQHMISSAQQKKRFTASVWQEWYRILLRHSVMSKTLNHRVGQARIPGLHVDILSSDQIPYEMDKFWQLLTSKEENMHPVLLAGHVHATLLYISPYAKGNIEMTWMAMNFMLIQQNYPLIYPEDKEQIAQYLRALGKTWKEKNDTYMYLWLLECLQFVYRTNR